MAKNPPDPHGSHPLIPPPLAERMRPRNLDEFIGQSHLTGARGVIRRLIQSAFPPSMILWGPPGSGKTTLARLIAAECDAEFVQINAISSGVKELREIIASASERQKAGRRTILFIDEIHRFNKSQQDALLESVERGWLTLIGATTENPSFEVISPLLSRCRVYTLNPLDGADLEAVLAGAFARDASFRGVELDSEAKSALINLSGGDARVMLSAIEAAASLAGDERKILKSHIQDAFQTAHYKYDRAGEEHHNSISAFIKSVRGSDPDAAVYYLARMLEAGEDVKFIARRLIVLASEDIGNAEPYALSLAAACFTAVDSVGMPEARIILSQTAIYLASCPKSNAAYLAVEKAISDVRQKPNLPVPLHLRNAPTRLMKDIGYAKDYKYSHDYDRHFSEQSYLPDELRDRIYYEPTELGREANIKKHLANLWKSRRK
ncbi:MAG: replication-associated recombination protein A [Deltaproteobacteria bacterium]